MELIRNMYRIDSVENSIADMKLGITMNVQQEEDESYQKRQRGPSITIIRVPEVENSTNERMLSRYKHISVPEISLYIYVQLIYIKNKFNGIKTIQWDKEDYFQQMGPGQLDTYMQKKEVGSLTHNTYKN